MSVEFEPIRLGRRVRRIDPVTIGVVAIAVALAFAVLKPWAGVASGPEIAEVEPSSALPSDSVVATDAPEVVLPRVIAARSDASLRWDAIEGIVREHDTWGINAIVVQMLADSPLNARQRFIERWYPLPVDGDAARPMLVDSNDRAILALGVTFPPAHTPLDVRIWRKTDTGFDWVETEPLDPVPSDGAYLYRRPGPTPATPRTWASGEYRIDVLVDGAIRRFDIAIPDRFSNVPFAPERPSLRDLDPMVAPSKVPLTDLPVGPFATVDRVAIPLDGSEGVALDEAGAWLDVDPGTGREPRGFVARVNLPRATGLGVNLPSRSVVMNASIARLAPEPLPEEPQRVDAGATGGTPTALVLFRAPGGSRWQPGVYRLSVRWADFEGLHEGSWHVELRPGPIREAPRLLAAARGWARFAGADGVILGTTEPPADGVATDPIELVSLRPEAAEYPVSTGIGCGETVIAGRPGILGFAYPADHYASSVRGRILRPFLRRDNQVLMTAAFGVPGLIIAAPARSSTLPAATYEFRLDGGDAVGIYTLCLGMASFDD